jgi:hypothetical protein
MQGSSSLPRSVETSRARRAPHGHRDGSCRSHGSPVSRSALRTWLRARQPTTESRAHPEDDVETMMVIGRPIEPAASWVRRWGLGFIRSDVHRRPLQGRRTGQTIGQGGAWTAGLVGVVHDDHVARGLPRSPALGPRDRNSSAGKCLRATMADDGCRPSCIDREACTGAGDQPSSCHFRAQIAQQ